MRQLATEEKLWEPSLLFAGFTEVDNGRLTLTPVTILHRLDHRPHHSSAVEGPFLTERADLEVGPGLEDRRVGSARHP